MRVTQVLRLASTASCLASHRAPLARARSIPQAVKAPSVADETYLQYNQRHTYRRPTETELEYGHLRNLARQEFTDMARCFERASYAYACGSGSKAFELSRAGKAHQAQGAAFNQEASNLMLRTNNKFDRVGEDTIDLHGQYIEEAEAILERRIHAAARQGRDHLYVIVGRGINSPHNVQRIRPKVEEICEELGFRYTVGEYAGEIFLSLRRNTHEFGTEFEMRTTGKLWPTYDHF